jgi:hypothetical protein
MLCMCHKQLRCRLLVACQETPCMQAVPNTDFGGRKGDAAAVLAGLPNYVALLRDAAPDTALRAFVEACNGGDASAIESHTAAFAGLASAAEARVHHWLAPVGSAHAARHPSARLRRPPAGLSCASVPQRCACSQLLSASSCAVILFRSHTVMQTSSSSSCLHHRAGMQLFRITVLVAQGKVDSPFDLPGLLEHAGSVGVEDEERVRAAATYMAWGNAKEGFGIEAGIRALGRAVTGCTVHETGFVSCHARDKSTSNSLALLQCAPFACRVCCSVYHQARLQ